MQRALSPISEPIVLAVALVAAAIMGLAIQRGGTCMVAAVEEAVSKRRWTKALALGEAAIWVSAFFAIAVLAGLPMAVPPSFAVNIWVVIGGLLLGLGALLNGACVIGSIARLGSGNWHYLLTPAGYFLGSALHDKSTIIRSAEGETLAAASSGWLAIAIVTPILAYRSWGIGKVAVYRRMPPQGWTAHQATAVIGMAFGVLVLVAGPWTYTDALSRLAHRMTGFGVLEGALFLMLLAGAVAGGWKRRTSEAWRLSTATACLAGGALMGFGGSMIPGGNDNLILVGLPMFHGYAWLAIVSMTAAIVLGLIVTTRLRGPEQGPPMAQLP